MKYLFLVFAAGAFFSCRNAGSGDGAIAADTVKKDDQVVMALLYQQRAAEYRALCLQSYNLAKMRVSEAVKGASAKPLAIVTDLDETALDNSTNEAWLYLHDSAYTPKEFDDWCVYGKAGSVPGSLAFFNFVDSLTDRKGRKVNIYYISNRTAAAAIVDSTMSQMRRLGFPQLTDAHFLFKEASSSKEARRRKVSETDSIVLLLGDNLVDLSAAFDHTAGDPEGRLKKVDSLSNWWGRRFIVFPNAQYGDWEAALYPGGKYPATLKTEKEERIKQLKAGHF